MSDLSKTSKRLGIVGAAAVVGLVPVTMLASPAFAVSNASLTLSSTVPTATNVTATNTFQITNQLSGGSGQLTVASGVTPGTGTPELLPVIPATTTYGVATPGTTAVTVTYGTSATSTSTVETGTVVASSNASLTLSVSTTIPAGDYVTVSIQPGTNSTPTTGVTNGSASAIVFFTDSTNADTGTVNTNSVTLGSTSVVTPTVSSVNPTAYTAAAGEPFTITGTGFTPAAGGATPTPVVCFVAAGTTVPTASTTNPCVATTTSGVNTVEPATGITVDPTGSEVQGLSPALTTGQTYNVVVYNYNATATTPTYTSASATSAQTLVGVKAGLNFVPESGIRSVNSVSGLALPKGQLVPKTPYSIPVAAFTNGGVNSFTNPTNIPAGATALSLNVTAVAPSGAGNLQVWSTTAANCTLSTAPYTSTVNFQPPQDTNNTTLLGIPAGTTNVCVQDNGAAVSVIMDVTGYTTAGYAAADATNPANRLLDTRSGKGGLLGPLASGTIYRFNAAALGLGGGTPVALNVTAVDPTSVGNLRVFPEPQSAVLSGPTMADVPNTSVITYIPKTDASSMFVTTVGPDGYIDIYSAGTGSVNVVFDEIGTLTSAGVSSSLQPVLTPFRIYDSRPGGIAAGSTVTVTGSPSGTGSVSVPAGALGLVGDIGDINPAAQGNLRTFPAGGAVPATSTINNFPMQTRSTSAVEALNPTNGAFAIESSGSATNATFDVTGYIAG